MKATFLLAPTYALKEAPLIPLQMEANRKIIRIRSARQEDLDSIENLLIASGLPPDGIENHLSSMLVGELEYQILATAALEMYGDSALLRSVAVDSIARGTGLGTRMTEAIVKLALRLRVNRLFLLTETAEDFFPKFGFRKVNRSDIPDNVKSSLEFTLLCPSSALALELRL